LESHSEDEELKRLIELARIGKEVLPREQALTSALEDFVDSEFRAGPYVLYFFFAKEYIASKFKIPFSTLELSKIFQQKFEKGRNGVGAYIRVNRETLDKVKQFCELIGMRIYEKRNKKKSN